MRPIQLLAILVLLALLGQPAQAELENRQLYDGNCLVVTDVDDLTDKKIHLITCGSSETALTIGMRPPDHLSIGLRISVPFHLNDFIPVMIRVDKGPLIKRSASWTPKISIAQIFDPALARQLLHDLARGQKVAIKVGTESGIISLTGARRAIEDFRQRTMGRTGRSTK